MTPFLDTATQGGNGFYGAYTIKPKRQRRTKAAVTSIRGAIKAILEQSHPQTVRQVFYAATVIGAVSKVEAEYQFRAAAPGEHEGLGAVRPPSRGSRKACA
jgi:hypothetical protein